MDVGDSADDLRKDALNEVWVKGSTLGQVVVKFVPWSGSATTRKGDQMPRTGTVLEHQPN